eukprot:TRINITY_DN4356_c0_g1_i2.p1 TRINITY_DN4356_c0_g1~~TRINITY_DN4356_c0_g1_i2.p1  ORF type:complete len:740 (-),score=158.49 TRINITY_DN4356_c0_g1_i2:133-2352(-)
MGNKMRVDINNSLQGKEIGTDNLKEIYKHHTNNDMNKKLDRSAFIRFIDEIFNTYKIDSKGGTFSKKIEEFLFKNKEDIGFDEFKEAFLYNLTSDSYYKDKFKFTKTINNLKKENIKEEKFKSKSKKKVKDGIRKDFFPQKYKPSIISTPIYQHNRSVERYGRGLQIKGTSEIFPLKDITAYANINDLSCKLVIKQKYVNDKEDPIEAVFSIPLFNNSFLSQFFTLVDNKKIVSLVREKELINNEIENNIKGAYLGQVTGRTYEFNIGTIPPKKTIEIEIEIIQILPTEGGEIGFIFQPELLPAHHIKYHTILNVEVNMSQGIKNLYAVNRELEIWGKDNNLNFTYDLKSTDFTSDFVLVIQPLDAFSPIAFVERSEDNKSMAIMLNYYPSWDDIDEDLVESSSEFIFLCDRSGSMSGGRITSVRDALIYFLLSLPESCKFNIISFGSTYSSLFPISANYNEENLEIAINHAKTIDADMAGTELYQPLKAIFEFPYDDNYPRQLFILTDGDITNTQQTIDLVKKEACTTRVFALGIGSAASRPLVTGLANAGKGSYEFVNEREAESLKVKVLAMLKTALEPILRNCIIDWPIDILGSKKSFQYPAKIRPIFNGERLMAVCLLTEIEKQRFPEFVKVPIKGKRADGKEFSIVLPVDVKTAKVGNTVHRIAGYLLCRELDEGTSLIHMSSKKDKKSFDKKLVEQLIVHLGTKYQIESSFTSYVMFEEKNQLVEGKTTCLSN